MTFIEVFTSIKILTTEEYCPRFGFIVSPNCDDLVALYPTEE